MKKLQFFIIPTCIALIFSLFSTAVAVADEGTPPPPATEEPVVIPPVSDPIQTEEPVLPPANEPQIEELPAAETPTSLPEILDQLPDNTSVVVTVDDQIEPLATQEAANAFAVGDPIWCPDDVPPTANVGGCTDSYADLYSLIDDIDNSIIPMPNEDGIIWIMQNNDTSTLDISIDGLDFPTWSTFQLTLQGGWDGSNSGTVSGISNFSVPLSIVNWGGSIIVNQISITGANATGLEVDTSGDIELEDVSSDGNSGYGAELNSSAGSVSLMGENTFINNDGFGLYIEAAGDIDAENLTVNNNGAADVIDFSGGANLTALGSVTLTGENIFNDNHETGLYIEANGDIDLESISADSNGVAGMTGNGAELYSLNNSVTLTGINDFSSNNGSGLYVESNVDVDVENVNASGNGTGGAEIYALGDVSFTGANIFNDNNNSGLYIEAGGDVDLEELTASGNNLSGAELHSSGDVTLSGANVFSNNNEIGLYVEAGTGIDAENINAENNGAGGVYGAGAELYTLGSFTLSGANAFNDNFSDGLLVDSTGDISIEYTDAFGNGVNGIFLETDSNASITCGILNGNALYALEADLPGTLTLAGVDFGGDIDTYLGVDEDQLSLISNGCFTYPIIDDEDDEEDDDGDGDADTGFEDGIEAPEIVLPVTTVKQADGQMVGLNCSLFSGTTITLSSGDGAYIPCPIVDSVRLVGIPDSSLPDLIPGISQYISGFVLSVFKEGQMVGAPDRPATVEYVETGSGQSADSEIIYWDGIEWSILDSETNPFISIFFSLPENRADSEYAIMYWSGSEWIELTDNLHLSDDRIVKKGGHVMENELSFGATINFTGIFVLIEK